MLIDFRQAQLDRFLEVAEKIQALPQQYLQFDSVSDFYKAAWLDDFPKGTIWYTSGLDDGADEFEAVICYAEAKLIISSGAEIQVRLKLSD